jgi:flagellin
VTSILTNNSAMVALQNLKSTTASLTKTQNEISTGLAVNTAKDNASVWTVATTMKANVATLNQVSSDLGNADSILGTATSGTAQLTSLVSQIRAKIVSFTDPAVNQTAIQADVTQLANQLQSTVESSSFNGVNLLDGSQSSGLTFVAATNNSYANGGSSPTITTGPSYDLSPDNAGTATIPLNFIASISGAGQPATATDVANGDIAGVPLTEGVPITPAETSAVATWNSPRLTANALITTTNANRIALNPAAPQNAIVQAFQSLVSNLAGAFPNGTIDAAIPPYGGTPPVTNLDNALDTIDQYSAFVESQASAFGSTQSNVAAQQTFVQNLAGFLSIGAGNMVDANMEAESAQLSALQIQQQLGTQALSVANQSPQTILKLFGG